MISERIQLAIDSIRRLKNQTEGELKRSSDLPTHFGQYEALLGVDIPSLITHFNSFSEVLVWIVSGISTVPFSRAHDLERNLVQVHAYRGRIQNAFTKARDLQRLRTIPNARQVATNLKSICECAGDIELALTNVLELIRDGIKDFTQQLTRAADRARKLDSALDTAYDRISNHTPTRTLDGDFEEIRNLNQNLAEDIYRALKRYQAYSRDHLVDREQGDWKNLLEFLRWYIRLQSLTLAAEFLFSLGIRTGRNRIEMCLDLYIDFVILEERIRGNLPAFEGIRIVKEERGRSVAL